MGHHLPHSFCSPLLLGPLLPNSCDLRPTLKFVFLGFPKSSAVALVRVRLEIDEVSWGLWCEWGEQQGSGQTCGETGGGGDGHLNRGLEDPRLRR